MRAVKKVMVVAMILGIWYMPACIAAQSDTEVILSGRFTFKGKPVEGVLLEAGKYGPSDTTDEMGRYSLSLPLNWSGKISLSKEGLDLESWSMTFKNIAKDLVMPDIELSKPKFTISGSIGMSGVIMKGLPGDPATDASGNYSVLVTEGWSGSIKPVKEGWAFDPPMMQYDKITADMLNQNYKASLRTYILSGSVGIGGVQMTGLPGDPVTAMDGTYNVKVPHAWTGKVSPSKIGYNFDPPSVEYRNIMTDLPNQNYDSSILTFTISGSVDVEGVVIQGLPGDPVTDADGNYSVILEFGWSGTVKPEKDGYIFTPASKTYRTLVRDYTSEDYKAKPNTRTISGQVI